MQFQFNINLSAVKSITDETAKPSNFTQHIEYFTVLFHKQLDTESYLWINLLDMRVLVCANRIIIASGLMLRI